MRVILVIFVKDNKKEIFGSLKHFYDKYPNYKQWKDQINYALSRKKQPFDHYDFTIYRMVVQRSLNVA